jgi:arylsulfatase A-like enzyme
LRRTTILHHYLPIAIILRYPEAGPFAEDQEFGRYLNALHYGDKILGHFLRELQVRGLDEKTLFVIFGDHGEAFGQHEGNYGHTLFIYDENIRVPLLIAAPGLIREQMPVNRIASLIDTAPTIATCWDCPPA